MAVFELQLQSRDVVPETDDDDVIGPVLGHCCLHLSCQMITTPGQLRNLLLAVDDSLMDLSKLLPQLQDICCQLLLVAGKPRRLLLQLQALSFGPVAWCLRAQQQQ